MFAMIHQHDSQRNEVGITSAGLSLMRTWCCMRRREVCYCTRGYVTFTDDHTGDHNHHVGNDPSAWQTVQWGKHDVSWSLSHAHLILASWIMVNSFPLEVPNDLMFCRGTLVDLVYSHTNETNLTVPYTSISWAIFMIVNNYLSDFMIVNNYLSDFYDSR